MIGQNILKESFKTVPKTVLLIGADGSGRRTFAKWLANSIGVDTAEIGGSVDDVRQLISTAYSVGEPVMYIIPSVEQMSGSAQNAMLKLLEEPPANAYFVMTATQENLVIPTILSRSQVYHMDAYSDDEILDYYRANYDADEGLESYIMDLCTCPGEVNLLMLQNVMEFRAYVDKVFRNIAKVSGANSFKIGSEINLADDSNKYDLMLFWRAFLHLCSKHYRENSKKYSYGIRVTCKSLSALRTRGANKQMAFDTWLLDLRSEWINADD